MASLNIPIHPKLLAQLKAEAALTDQKLYEYVNAILKARKARAA